MMDYFTKVKNQRHEVIQMPTYTRQINATDDWTEAFQLQNGQTGTLTAAGQWSWDNSGMTCGPGGNGQNPPPNCPTVGRQGSLDWRVMTFPPLNPPGNSVQAYITYFSTDNQSYPINVAGTYQFRMNDDKLDDNSGSLTVTAVVA